MSRTLLDSLRTNPPTSFSSLVSLVRQIEDSDESIESEASVVILRNLTLDNIGPYLKYHLLRSNIKTEVVFGAYDNVHQELLDPGSPVHSAPRSALVLALWLARLDESWMEPNWSADSAIKRLQELFQVATKQTTAMIGINTFLPDSVSHTGPVQPKQFPSRDLEISRLNHFVRAYARDHGDRFFLIDWERLCANLGRESALDARTWYLAKMPFTNRFLDVCALEVAKVVRALKGKAKKALVLDCDGTLWGGVVGEDGLEGIKLDPDEYPGNIFYAFQRSIIDLMTQGVAVILNSKNNLDDVWEVLDNHPHCLLKRQHLSCFRINWQDKVTNLREIAAELNLGLDSFVFIDDSGVECQLVRDHLPMVEVLRVPESLVQLPELLFRDGLFNSLSKSQEDRDRTEMYRAEAKRQSEKSQFTNLDDFIASLEIVTKIERDPVHSLARVAQLIQKTNQFNLTTRRYSEGEIQAFLDAPDSAVYTLHVSDKYGEYGLTGLGIFKKQDNAVVIDTLLLSCRILGRAVEKGFLDHVMAELQAEWRPTEWRAEYLVTKKNSQVLEFWEAFGFEVVSRDEAGKRYRRGPAGV